MKHKHLAIRIEQCIVLSKASNCPRRKFGALLIDPKRNVILMDGYNGGPREGSDLCGGERCYRDGIQEKDCIIHGPKEPGKEKSDSYSLEVVGEGFITDPEGRKKYSLAKAENLMRLVIASNPPIESGTHVEIGCVHAEMNVICNCAANGVATLGAWLIVTGEPCLMCAKLIHHAGITRVFAVSGGYKGSNGVEYLKKHGVEVTYVDGPKDPRLQEQDGKLENGVSDVGPK